ncbi:MAG: hypothetical protein HZA31_10100 [Opitutae bacterium]|nr:hypothetical protein [Opitutae bacterium]
MQNEPELSALWPDIRKQGTAALRPHLAQRVLARVAAARDELSPQTAVLVGFGAVMACLALTLAVNSWREHRANDEALAQWSVVAAEGTKLGQEDTL